MVVYYRGPTALITHQVLEVWCPYRQRFVIADLYDVHVVRGGADPLAVRSTYVAGGIAVAVAASWPFLTSPVAWGIAVAAVLTIVGLTAGFWRMSRTELELRATYHGLQVQLFHSRDPQVFGQVRRALARAIEAHVGV